MDFQTIYKRYYREVLYYSNRIFSSNKIGDHWELAQDCVQEAFVAAYKHWDKFQSDINVKAFLYLVAKNNTLNKLSDIKRHDKSHKEIAYLTKEAEIPDYLAMNSDIIGFILEQIETLTPQRSIIIKLYFKGLTSHEIAAKLGITIKTALNTKRQATEELKQKVLLKFG